MQNLTVGPFGGKKFAHFCQCSEVCRRLRLEWVIQHCFGKMTGVGRFWKINTPEPSHTRLMRMLRLEMFFWQMMLLQFFKHLCLWQPSLKHGVCKLSYR